jgi:hypothetical protein
MPKATMISNLRKALAAPEQEPVAVVSNLEITQAIEQAIEAMSPLRDLIILRQAIASLRRVLPIVAAPVEVPEQEPVATVQCVRGITFGYLDVMQPVGTKLYAAPPDIESLTKERDELKSSNDSYITLANTAYAITEQRTAERDALMADAERYRWLRRSATKLSLDNALIGSLVRDQAELDGAIKEAGAMK